MKEKLKKLREAMSLDRRGMLRSTGAVMGAMAAGGLLKSNTASAQPGSGGGAKMDNNTFVLSMCGEMLSTRRLSMQTDPGFMKVVEILRNSDVAFGHAEMNFGYDEELAHSPRGTAGVASYMIADPEVLHDLAWMGFDSLSLAHNHSYDWGPEGLRSTLKHCREAGLHVAGMGNDLEEATAPVFFENDKGRIAMISVGSGNNQYEWAGYGKGPIPGKPGMNPLRVFMTYEVPPDAADNLKAVGRGLGVLSEAAAQRDRFNITPGTGTGGTGAASFTFSVADGFDVKTTCHEKDLERNLRAVDEGRKMADFVIVSHHNSISEQGRAQTPPDFMFDFARKCIDAGADVYFGHGWHTCLGVEIYNGKPIIYGAGNFIHQSGYLTRVPPDSYAAWGYDLDNLTTLHPAISDIHPGSNNEDWLWTAVYELKYEDGQLDEILIHPVDLGMDFSSGQGVQYRTVGVGLEADGTHKLIDGTPWVATGANARAILERHQHVCQLRGTEMQIRGGVGVIRVS